MTATPSVTSLLRSWWHGLRSGPRRMAAPAGLGVDGLPHGVGRLPVGSPAALLVQDEARYRAWAPALLADLLAAGPVLALAARPQDIDDLLRIPALRQAHEAGRLRTWLLPAAAQERLRRDGLAALVRELGRIGPGAQASLCVLDANATLTGATIAELQRLAGHLRRWSMTLRWPLVLLFPTYRLDGGAAGDIAAVVRSLGSTFGHVAELGAPSGRPVLTLYRWDGDQGAVFHARYGLRMADGEGEPGRLRYGGSFSQGAVPVLVEAPDQFAVHATQACVARQRGVPAAWSIAPSLAALEEAVCHAVGATVVLDAGAPEQFEAVASLVHRLRLSRPRSLKIIVRETDAKLRSHGEQALLSLGATAVVYREVGFSRLLRLIEDNRHQIHARTIESDYERALAGFMPAAARGYQPPARFAQLAGDMLARTGAVGLAHCLVRLQLLPGVAHLDALRACRALRDGDLVTADAQSIHVFLFACREPDLEPALGHLFTLPLGQLFSSQMSDGTASGMALMLERLSAAAQALPDYRPLLAPVAPAARLAQAMPRGAAAPAGDGVDALPAASPPAPGAQAPRISARPIGRRRVAARRASPAEVMA